MGKRRRRRRRITIINFLPDSLLVFKLISKREGKFRSRSKPRNKFVAFRKSVSESESTFATWCKEALLSVLHGRKYEGVRQAERKVSSSKRVFSTRARRSRRASGRVAGDDAVGESHLAAGGGLIIMLSGQSSFNYYTR